MYTICDRWKSACRFVSFKKKKKGFRNNSTKVTGFWFLWFGMSEKFSLNLQKSIQQVWLVHTSKQVEWMHSDFILQVLVLDKCDIFKEKFSSNMGWVDCCQVALVLYIVSLNLFLIPHNLLKPPVLLIRHHKITYVLLTFRKWHQVFNFYFLAR